jgi:hypothetical protein
VAGSYRYSPALGTVLHAGPQTLSVTFTPTNTTDYATATDSVKLTVNTGTTLSLSGTSLSFTGGLTPATWTILVNGSKLTNVPATTTAVSFTGTGGSAKATITGASASGESAAIAPGRATFNGLGSNGPYTVTATNLFAATVTSGGSGSLSVTDATGGNILTESPTSTTLASAGNSARAMVAKGFNNVIATATGAGSGTVANLFDSAAGTNSFVGSNGKSEFKGLSFDNVAMGFATVNAYSKSGGTDTATLTGTAGADNVWLWSTNALMKMSTGNTVRAWYFASYNLDGGGGRGDTVTTMDASVLPTRQTAVAGAKVIAWLANFAEMNQDYSPGSQKTDKSYALAADEVLTAYWS